MSLKDLGPGFRIEIQTRFDGKAKEPYSGICCSQCWFAEKEPCVCRCGGAFHGLGNKEHKQRDPREFALTNSQAKEFYEQIKINKCRWCGENLSNEPILAYEHSAGWVVKGFDKRLWLYIHCPKCSYEWALWKLGVNRHE